MIRISVTGPESTGKSWLARRLAEYYSTEWVPEFARQYLEDIKRPYTYDDILFIAEKQYESENSALRRTDLLFCDTDFCVTSIWCNVKYGKCHDWISAKLSQNNYSLYLLCDVDLPWQYDPLREHPEIRNELFTMYTNLLIEHQFNYRIVNGSGEKRLENAVHFVDEFLRSVEMQNRNKRRL
jgi:NadR type nicotinamide-nucleotide adenylyltransferase